VQEIFLLDSGRLIFVSLTFLFYFFVCIKTKKPFFYTTLFLLAMFPFNITLQQPDFNVYIQGIYSNYLVPTLSIIDVFIFFLLLASFFEKKKWNFSKNTTIFFVIFFLFLTLKAYLDNSLLSTLLLYRIFFYTFGLFLVVQHFNFKKHLKSISWIILFSILIQFFIGLIQFKEGTSLGLHFLGESTLVKGMLGSSFIDLNGTLFLRAYGTFPHPNILAGFLLTTLFFTINFLNQEKINILTSILATILIFLTFSRITILLTVLLWIGFVVFKIKEKQKKTRKKKRKILLFYTPLFFTRFTNLFLEKDSSFLDRLELMKTAKEIIQNHPYFGIGVGRFVFGLDLYPVYTKGGFLLLQPVHNVFLLILSEYGFVFGIPLLLLILFLLFKNFFKHKFFFKFGSFCIFFVLIFDHYPLTLPQGNLMFVFLLILLQDFDIFTKKR
jgi:O-antigen ligase